MPSTHLMHGFVSHGRSATGHASFIGGRLSSGGRHSNAHLLEDESLSICVTEDARRRTRTRRKAWTVALVSKDDGRRSLVETSTGSRHQLS
jgi:hypothetical protein